MKQRPAEIAEDTTPNFSVVRTHCPGVQLNPVGFETWPFQVVALEAPAPRLELVRVVGEEQPARDRAA